VSGNQTVDRLQNSSLGPIQLVEFIEHGVGLIHAVVLYFSSKVITKDPTVDSFSRTRCTADRGESMNLSWGHSSWGHSKHVLGRKIKKFGTIFVKMYFGGIEGGYCPLCALAHSGC